ncbi:MAG: phosphatase PAP2 family protein, partial [Clostridia bacterium]|nr:phosphatase PAP2 family protein [Clostridia bacterium]
MALLYWLESIRTPALDAVMLTVTHLGEEILFMVAALFMMWCVNKYEGYYLLSVGLLGTQINQFLKVTFRIPRPWNLDPQFHAVEAAIPEATGYSFPSGHTQCAVGTYGGIAAWNRSLWVRIGGIVIAALVA